MSDLVNYTLYARFNTQKAARRFVKEEQIKRFFSEIGRDDDNVVCMSPRETSCRGHRRQGAIENEVNEVLHRYMKFIISFWVEHYEDNGRISFIIKSERLKH